MARTYQRTHEFSKLSRYLYNFSLYSLIAVITVVLISTAYDIGQQVFPAYRGKVRYSDSAITGGGYVTVGIASLCIVVSRYYSVKRVLRSIPKGYLPIGEDEITKNMYRLVASEYTRCSLIVHATQPRGRTLPGYGAPNSPYPSVHFRSAILSTLPVLTTLLPTPPSSTSKRAPLATRSGRAAPLSAYTPLFANGTLPKSLLPLLDFYEKIVEDAKWKREEPTQEEYETALRIVAVFADVINKSKKVRESAGSERDEAAG